MAGSPINPTIDAPIQFAYDINYEAEKIRFRLLVPISLMHSCIETNTYVLDIPAFNNMAQADQSELVYDLYRLNDTPLPFGQITFLSYYGKGEFMLEAATERFKPHLVEEAFRSFGYTEVKIDENYVSVSEKDQFKLKLKYGI